MTCALSDQRRLLPWTIAGFVVMVISGAAARHIDHT